MISVSWAIVAVGAVIAYLLLVISSRLASIQNKLDVIVDNTFDVEKERAKHGW